MPAQRGASRFASGSGDGRISTRRRTRCRPAGAPDSGRGLFLGLTPQALRCRPYRAGEPVHRRVLGDN